MKAENDLYFWLSFGDDITGENLGTVITKASNFNEALNKTHDLLINPGGEIFGFEMDSIAIKQLNITNDLLDRLIQKSEIISRKIGEPSRGY